MSQFFIWMSLLKQGSIHQPYSFNLWMIRAGNAKDGSCKGQNLITPFIHVFKIFVNQKGFFFFGGVGGLFCFFGSVWPWENSVPCYSHIAVPAYETISCRWCLSLIFHVLHMPVHTQKAHSCSYCTRKTGKCFRTEDLLSSFHQRKQTSLAFTDFSWLLCKPNKFSIKASFGLPGSTAEDCTLWLLLWDHMLLEQTLSPWSGGS